MSDLTNFLNTLSYNDFKNIVEQYSNKNNVNFDSQMETLVTNSLETKLHNLKVNCTCLTYYCTFTSTIYSCNSCISNLFIIECKI